MNKASPITVIITLVLAMGMRAFPWPDTIAAYSPDWILLFLLYWCLHAPDRFGLALCWALGLFADVLTAHTLGQHALSYTLVAYLAHRLQRRIHMAPITEESMFVLLLALFSQLVLYISDNFIAPSDADWTYWLPSVTGAIVWPVLRGILNLIGSFSQKVY